LMASDVMQRAPKRDGWAYAYWLVVGAALGTGFPAILTFGIVPLALGGLMIIVGVLTPRLSNESQLAAIAGLALPALYMAWLNRRGPGTVCTLEDPSADAAARLREFGGDACADLYSPWPFVAAAVILVIVSIVLIRAARRKRVARIGR
jgi:hypothetical protein